MFENPHKPHPLGVCMWIFMIHIRIYPYKINSMSTSSDYAVETDRLTKSFEEEGKSKEVLKGITLKIKKNQIFGLLGPNGAGKTTLICILAGLLHADSGDAKVLGFNPKTERVDLAKSTNICSGNSLFFYIFTPREILKYYGFLYGMSEKAIEENTNRLIKDLGITAFEHKTFHELSTGMKQKVSLAKALINEPELVFLDEPTLGLDVEVARSIRKYVSNLVKTKKMTIILTSHYLSEVEELCDNIAIINQGKIIAEGTVGKIKSISKAEATIIAITKKPCRSVKFLEKIPGVTRAQVRGKEIVAYVEGGTMPVEEVIASFKKNNVELSDIEVRKATLEEAFMRLVNSEGQA